MITMKLFERKAVVKERLLVFEYRGYCRRLYQVLYSAEGAQE